MIETLRKNPGIARVALSIITVLFCAGLFLPNQNAHSSIGGKRAINPIRFKETVSILQNQNPHLTQDQIEKAAYEHEKGRVNLASKIERSGIIPSNQALKSYFKANKIAKEDFDLSAKRMQTTTFHLKQDIQDTIAQTQVLQAVHDSHFASTQLQELVSEAKNHAQRVVDVDLSEIEYATDMQTLKEFYNQMPEKPMRKAQVKLKVLNISSLDQEKRREIRKLAFQNPSDLDMIAKHVALKPTEYKGDAPSYLPSDLETHTWFTRGYVSDILSDEHQSYLVRIIEYKAPQTLGFNQCVKTVKQAYLKAITLPKVLLELHQASNRDKVIKKYNLNSTLKSITDHQVFSQKHSRVLKDENDQIHFEYIDGYTSTSEGETALSSNIIELTSFQHALSA